MTATTATAARTNVRVVVLRAATGELDAVEWVNVRRGTDVVAMTDLAEGDQVLAVTEF
ncbi:hypothetical protein [Pseudonocardia sp. T1-2H]|uniref:hypothetical protein n=1 Tax=Pseudonocardia sp. T1-2H TaxID=3128899 RepID=UPI00310164D2